eukprot:Em0013g1009a
MECNLDTYRRMYRCKLCAAPVLKSEDRKKLASLTSASCVAALVDLACESGTAKTEATQMDASGCKKCFNSIAKYPGLKEELLSKLSKVHHSSSSASSSSGTGTSEISQGTKRKADAALQGANAVEVGVTYDSCKKSDASDDIPSEPNECPSQSTPGIGNECNEEWYGFRLVGDNVDKNVKPRDMHLNSQTTSLHYFHMYAVKDRICFRHISTDTTEIVQDSINFEMFYPTVGAKTQFQ